MLPSFPPTPPHLCRGLRLVLPLVPPSSHLPPSIFLLCSPDDGNLIRFPEVDEQRFKLARHLLNQGHFPTPPPPSTSGVLDTVRQFWDQLVSR